MDKTQKYIAMFKELMEEDEKLSKEVFFDFFSEYASPDTENIFEDNSNKTSYWILLINGINNHSEVVLVKELLFWKEFFSRETTSIRCFQSSDQRYFNAYLKKFAIKNTPALILSDTKKFSDHIVIEKENLLKLVKDTSNISTVLNQIQFKLITGESIKEIKEVLKSGELFSHLKKVVELKKMVSNFRLKEVIDYLISSDSIRTNSLKLNEIVNISSQYSSLQSKKKNSLISNSDHQIEINKIVVNILETIDYYEIES